MKESSKKIWASIIIPAFNEEQNIGRCLESLQGLNTANALIEVFVVDNGSTDNTRVIAEGFKGKLNIKVLTVPEVNVSTLRNIGVKGSSGDILAFVDADCTVCPDWIERAAEYLSDSETGAVGCSVCVPAEASWVARIWDLNNARRRRLGETSFLPTGNLIVTRKNFLKIDGFDDRLASNEDFDFCYRLRKEGFRIFSDPEIRVVHWGVPTGLLSFYRREKWHGTHVFKVFLSSVRELKNLKAVAYALYYIFSILFVLFSVILGIATDVYRLFFVSLLFFFIPPLLLAFRTLRSQGHPMKYFPGMSVIYLVYGLARAASIINVKNWAFSKGPDVQGQIKESQKTE